MNAQRALRRRPWTFGCAVLLLTVAGAAAYLALRPVRYVATARLQVNPIAAGDTALIGLPLVRDTGDPVRTIQTAAVLVRTVDIAAATAATLGGSWTTQRVLSRVSVSPVGQSNVLAVSATAPSSAQAAQLADAYTGAVLDSRKKQVEAAASAALAAARRLLGGAADQQTGTTSPAQQRVSELEAVVAVGDPSISISSRASVPLTPSGPSTGLVLAAAVALGVILAVASVQAIQRVPEGRPRDAAVEEQGMHARSSTARPRRQSAGTNGVWVPAERSEATR